jgi:hypothetical protein
MSITEMAVLVRRAEQCISDKFTELLEPTLLEDLELRTSEINPEEIVQVVLDIDVHDLLQWAVPEKTSRAVGKAMTTFKDERSMWEVRKKLEAAGHKDWANRAECLRNCIYDYQWPIFTVLIHEEDAFNEWVTFGLKKWSRYSRIRDRVVL